MTISIKRKIKKLSSGNKKYPFEQMAVGDVMDTEVKYTIELSRSIYGSIAWFKKKAGNSKKVFSVGKTPEGNLGVWRDK